MGGDQLQRPRIALDLHYLITVRGSTEWQTQELLATTAAALHAVPVLTAALLADAESVYAEIVGNDLAASEELVRITPETLSVEELNGIWGLFPPSAFAVSLAVSAGPVLTYSA